jgi:hypothetical protein
MVNSPALPLAAACCADPRTREPLIALIPQLHRQSDAVTARGPKRDDCLGRAASARRRAQRTLASPQRCRIRWSPFTSRTLLGATPTGALSCAVSAHLGQRSLSPFRSASSPRSDWRRSSYHSIDAGSATEQPPTRPRGATGGGSHAGAGGPSVPDAGGCHRRRDLPGGRRLLA